MNPGTIYHNLLDTGRTFFGIIPRDADLLESLQGFCEEKGIECAVVSANGTLEDARLGAFDSRQRVFATRAPGGPLEMAACSGNVFPLEGKPFAALWAVLVNPKGELAAGRIFSPSRALSVEFTMTELRGSRFTRSMETAMAFHPLVCDPEDVPEEKPGS